MYACKGNGSEIARMPITGNTSVCRICSSCVETLFLLLPLAMRVFVGYATHDQQKPHRGNAEPIRLWQLVFYLLKTPRATIDHWHDWGLLAVLSFLLCFLSFSPCILGAYVIMWFSLSRSSVSVPILFDSRAYRPSCSWRRSGQRAGKRQTRCRQANERQAGNNAINLKCLISGLTRRLGLKLINIIYVMYVKIGEGG